MSWINAYQEIAHLLREFRSNPTNFLKNHQYESPILEYKASFELDEAMNLCPLIKLRDKELFNQALSFRILKTLTAFANTSGGVLIMGVVESKSGIVNKRQGNTCKHRFNEKIGQEIPCYERAIDKYSTSIGTLIISGLERELSIADMDFDQFQRRFIERFSLGVGKSKKMVLKFSPATYPCDDPDLEGQAKKWIKATMSQGVDQYFDEILAVSVPGRDASFHTLCAVSVRPALSPIYLHIEESHKRSILHALPVRRVGKTELEIEPERIHAYVSIRFESALVSQFMSTQGLHGVGRDGSDPFLPVSPGVKFKHPSWYVKGLHGDMLRSALEGLRERSFIEIVGPSEIGKSAFIKELLDECMSQEPGRAHHEIALDGCGTPRDICIKILSEIYENFSSASGQETLVRQLNTEPCTFWISEVDRRSRIAFIQFIQLLEERLSTPGLPTNAHWIIESEIGLTRMDGASLEIVPLDNTLISSILGNVPAGGGYTDPELVIHLAQGSPGKAVRLWQSRPKIISGEMTDKFDWLRLQLDEQEFAFLSGLCLASSNAPLGVSFDVLEKCAHGIYRHKTPSEINKALRKLLKKLESRQLIHITHFEKSTFDGLLDDLLPGKLAVNIINRVSPELMEYVLASMGEDEKNQWKEQFQEILLSDENNHSLGMVTIGILWKDFTNFFYSSFRFTSAPVLHAWLERKRWRRLDDKQAYLCRAINLLGRIPVEPDIDIVAELGHPQSHDKDQLHAFNIVKAWFVTHFPADIKFDAPTWQKEIRKQKEPDLQAEMLACSASTLLAGGKQKEAWRLLSGLLNQTSFHPTTRCFIISRALEFLNRTKNRKKALSDSRADELIEKLSRELLQKGIENQNLTLICDALFYYVRSKEMIMARSKNINETHIDILKYLVAMEFVESMTGPRNRRLQALQTQGSIHRHACRRPKIDWNEFRQHMERGLELYFRAFESALVKNEVTYILNTVSYSITFCLKSLRLDFQETICQDKNEKAFLVGSYSRAAEKYKRMSESITTDVSGELNKRIFRNIQIGYGVHSYVLAVLESNSDKETLHDVEARFAILTEYLLEKNDISRYDTDLAKNLIATFTNIRRALLFCKRLNGNLNDKYMNAVQNPIVELLEQTSWMRNTKNRRLKSVWRKLSSLFNMV